jgi:hypothetical protein
MAVSTVGCSHKFLYRFWTMASDLEARMLEEEEAQNPSGIPECLVRWDMEMVTLGSGGAVVNDADAMSATLAREVKSKAFRLLVDYKKPGFSSVKAGHGQASFIRREKIGASPGGLEEYAVIPVTAKHNIRRYDGYDAQANPKMLIDESFRVDTTFPNINWTNTLAHRIPLHPGNQESTPAFWQFGADICVGGKIGAIGDFFTKEAYSFEAVRKSFIPLCGMKVGIAVLFSTAAKPTRATVAGAGEVYVAIDEEKLAKLYGNPNEPNMYTGTIKAVGEGSNHIEYDLNTFTGCAGAAVFLLDKHQPLNRSILPISAKQSQFTLELTRLRSIETWFPAFQCFAVKV